MNASKIAVHRDDLEKAASELDEGILFLVDFESMLPRDLEDEVAHLHAARRLLASVRLTVQGELSAASHRVVPLPNLAEDPDETRIDSIYTSGESRPVSFTDAQIDYLRGLLDVAHDRVFRRHHESRSGASPVEALLEAALYRAAGATVLGLPGKSEAAE